MKLLSKSFFGTGLVLGLTTLGLSAQTSLNLGRLPLHFEATKDNQSFVARGTASEFLISATESRFTLQHADRKPDTARMNLLGANPNAQVEATGELSGKVNYLIGNNSQRWQTSQPLFSRVGVSEVYPGISVVYYGNQQQLEYDFNLAAGASPDAIQLRFDGAKQVCVNSKGDLVVSLNDGEVVQHAPVAYQISHGFRQEIAAGYKILDDHTAAFSIGNYNRAEPLVIDPVLSFATYFGGNNGEIAHAVAVDNGGNIYIAGETLSPSLATNGYQTNFTALTQVGEAFVSKFNSAGNLIYCTYLGGSDNQTALGLAVDTNGNVYITGWTDSPDFPVKNAKYAQISGNIFPQVGHYPVDAYVSELNTNGTDLVYSTYFGGNGYDVGTSIAVDQIGNAYIIGYTDSTNIPTKNPIQNKLACAYTFPGPYNYNAFVAEIAAGGTNLNYGSYLGGTNYDQAMGIAVDTNGYIYVTGFTASTNFPTINGLTNYTQLNGSNTAPATYDAFVCKFYPQFTNNAHFSTVTNWAVYSTLLGGSGIDQASGISYDASGNAYVVGFTTSPNFSGTNTTQGLSTYVAANSGITNAFLSKVQWNGTNAGIGFSTVFGGNAQDFASGVAIDSSGNIFVVGSTTSTNFPVTTNDVFFGSLTPTNSGASDVFVTAITANGSNLLYSTYLGGNDNDFGNAIAVDASGNAYVVGQTFSTNLPAINARQNSLNGTSDAFLAKIFPQSTPPVSARLSHASLQISWPIIGQTSTNLLGLQASTNLLGTNWSFAAQSPVLTNSAYVYTVPATNPAQFFRLHLK